MEFDAQLDRPLTRISRLAAFSLIVLLAFLALGCQALPGFGKPSGNLAYRAPDACGEGLLAARAWQCLSGTSGVQAGSR